MLTIAIPSSVNPTAVIWFISIRKARAIPNTKTMTLLIHSLVASKRLRNKVSLRRPHETSRRDSPLVTQRGVPRQSAQSVKVLQMKDMNVSNNSWAQTVKSNSNHCTRKVLSRSRRSLQLQVLVSTISSLRIRAQSSRRVIIRVFECQKDLTNLYLNQIFKFSNTHGVLGFWGFGVH